MTRNFMAHFFQLEIQIRLMWRECMVLYFISLHVIDIFLYLIYLMFWAVRSMLARDLQSIVLYDQEGKFVGVRRPSSKLPIDIDGMSIVIEDAIGSTGLDLKVRTPIILFHCIKLYCWFVYCFILLPQTDPGVPVVYAGFGALMLTTCISFLSHSQVLNFLIPRNNSISFIYI